MGVKAQSARPLIKWATNVTVGPDGFFRVFADDGAGGAMDWDNQVAVGPIAAWPPGDYPGGLGTGPLGSGGLGHGYWGFGLGNGPLGNGPLGRGSALLTATGKKLLDGAWTLCVVAYDALGNADALVDRIYTTLTIAGTPEPPGKPTATWNTGTLTLTWTLSADDEDA